MALVETLVHETSTTSGTGDLDLDGPVDAARTFLAAFGASGKCLYVVRDGDDYEYGEGTVISGTPNKLQRGATPIGSSNGGALVSWPVGGKRDVYSELPAERMLIGRHNTTATTDPTVTDDSAAGYARGSLWFNTAVEGVVFQCSDPAVGAAVWRRLGLPFEGSLFRLGLANNGTDADHDIDVAAGRCYGTGSGQPDTDITLAAITKQIDGVGGWVAGTNQRGLSSSLTLAADTWYHVHAILVGGVADMGFDTSVVAAKLIADHAATHYRRLGSVLTDGSSNIIAFFQSDDVFLWKSPPLDINVTNQSTTGLSRVLSTPPDVRILAIVNHSISHSSANVTVNFQSGGANDEAPSRTAAPLGHTAGLHDGTTDFRDQSNSLLLTNASSTISSRSTQASTSLFLATVGWIDPRGRLS